MSSSESGLSVVGSELNKLKWRNTSYVCNESTQIAFDGLKQSLTTEPILDIADAVGEFELDTNASAVAISFIGDNNYTRAKKNE